MSNGVKVSIAKIMIARAPAMSREAGQLLSADGGEVRFITAVPLLHALRSMLAVFVPRSLRSQRGEPFHRSGNDGVAIAGLPAICYHLYSL